MKIILKFFCSGYWLFHIKMNKLAIKNNFIFSCIYGMLYVPLFQVKQLKQYNYGKKH